jgi:hypothetical protein
MRYGQRTLQHRDVELARESRILSLRFPTPAWRNWQPRWTQNLVFAPRQTFARSYGREQERTVMTSNDIRTVNTVSTATLATA